MAYTLYPNDRFAGLLDPSITQNPFNPKEYGMTAVTVNFLKNHATNAGILADSDIKINIINIVRSTIKTIADSEIRTHVIAGYKINANIDAQGRVVVSLDSDIINRINNEAAIRYQVDSDNKAFLQKRIDSDYNQLQGLISALQMQINTEINNRIAGDSDINVRINKDSDRLSATIIRVNKDSDAIVGIINRANTDSDRLTTEIAARVKGDSDLKIRIDSDFNYILGQIGGGSGTSLQSQINAEVAARKAGDSDLNVRANKDSELIVNVIRRLNGDSDIIVGIITRANVDSDRLTAEIATRYQVDSDNKAYLNKRIDSDFNYLLGKIGGGSGSSLQSQITAEIAARKAGDSDLNVRANADSERLSGAISRANADSDLLAATIKRLNADSDIISGIITRANNDSDRVTDIINRANADSDRVTAVINRANNDSDRLTSETANRKTADSDLGARIIAETMRAMGVENRIVARADKDSDRLTTEITTRTTQVTLINQRLDRDSDLIAAIDSDLRHIVVGDSDQALKNILNDIVTRQLNIEITNRQAWESADSDRLTREINRATAKENTLAAQINLDSDRLTTEISRAKAAENRLDARSNLDSDRLTVAINRLNSDSDIISGIIDRANNDSDRVDGIITRADNDSDRLSAEITRAKAAEAGITARVNADSDKLAATIKRVNTDSDLIKGIITRANADSDLLAATIASIGNDSDIIQGIITRANNDSDLLAVTIKRVNTDSDNIKGIIAQANKDSDRLTTEITNRIKGDSDLKVRIDSEIKRATAAESRLDARINADSDLLAATIKRVNNDSDLVNGFDSRIRFDSDRLDSEIANRMAADSDLGARIDSEITHRIAGDSDLQSQINALKKSLDSERLEDSDILNKLFTYQTNLNRRLDSEIRRAKAAEGALNTAANADSDRLTAEITNRIKGDSDTKQYGINQLAIERAARVSKDSDLQSQIRNEAGIIGNTDLYWTVTSDSDAGNLVNLAFTNYYGTAKVVTTFTNAQGNIQSINTVDDLYQAAALWIASEDTGPTPALSWNAATNVLSYRDLSNTLQTVTITQGTAPSWYISDIETSSNAGQVVSTSGRWTIIANNILKRLDSDSRTISTLLFEAMNDSDLRHNPAKVAESDTWSAYIQSHQSKGITQVQSRAALDSEISWQGNFYLDLLVSGTVNATPITITAPFAGVAYAYATANKYIGKSYQGKTVPSTIYRIIPNSPNYAPANLWLYGTLSGSVLSNPIVNIQN